MSNNVFGIPVTDSVVAGAIVGITNITARDRATVAFQYMNADGRADDARAFVSNLKVQYGNGTSTLCAIFNATGNNLTLIRSHTWEGDVFRSPYPQLIQNGQWASFLHVRGRLMGPSKEAVVYRGRNLAGQERDWVLAWNTSRRDFQNRVYTEVRTAGSTINWNTVDANMERQQVNHQVTTLGCFSSVAVGAGSSPYFTGITSLEGVNNRDGAAPGSELSAIFPSLDSERKDDEGVDDGAEDVPTPLTAEDVASPAPAAE